MFSGEVDNGLIFYIIFTATDALMQEKEVKREKKRKGRWGRRGEGSGGGRQGFFMQVLRPVRSTTSKFLAFLGHLMPNSH